MTLFDLVKLSLRERPDFVILGESRGEEVQVLFQAAATGTGCLTTFHAQNTEGLTTRLTQPPLSVARLPGAHRRGGLHGQGPGRAQVRPEVVEPAGEGRSVDDCLLARGERGAARGLAEPRQEGRGFGYSAKRISAELERRTAVPRRAGREGGRGLPGARQGAQGASTPPRP